MKNRLLTLLAAAALVCGTTAFAAQKGEANRMTHESASDTSFAKKAAEGGMFEVQTAQYVKDHASSQDVKDFAQKMIDDHSKANDQLKDWASKNNVTLPTQLTGKEETTYNRLSKMNGDSLDKAYMQTMLTDHRKDIAEFEHEANHGTNPELKQWAENTVPTLKEHLSLAEQTAPKVGVNTTKTTTTHTKTTTTNK